LPSNEHSVSHLTQCLFLHYLGTADQAKYALKYTKNVKKNIRNIIDGSLKKYSQILIIFGTNIYDTSDNETIV